MASNTLVRERNGWRPAPNRKALLTTLREIAQVAPAALERASPQQPVMTSAFRGALQAMLASVESRTETAARQ